MMNAINKLHHFLAFTNLVPVIARVLITLTTAVMALITSNGVRGMEHLNISDPLSSYANFAQDIIGSTGAASAALGRPDYVFINDITHGGTNANVFDVGESAVFAFPAPLRNIVKQHDLLISAFVGGLGATDNAQVEVEVSSDGVEFENIAVFETQEGRTVYPFIQEREFESVKHFEIEFGCEDFVTHVRLTNLGGTTEGLRLDAIEGLHPAVGTKHAFEIRFERYRDDLSERFLVRIKNLAQHGGVPITGFFFGRPPVTAQWLEETENQLLGSNGTGRFICVENCIGDADDMPGVWSGTLAWSEDGETVAPAGIGLKPGHQAGHERFRNYDIDSGTLSYLGGFEFKITFADGYTHEFDFDEDVIGFDQIGAIYQKYTYFSGNPFNTGPRPVHYYEFRRAPTATSNDTILTLKKGWNLISIPTSTEQSITELFAEVMTGNLWYQKDQILQIATVLEPKVGYWLYSRTGGSIEILGEDVGNSADELQNGWNLVGPIGNTVIDSANFSAVLHPSCAFREPIWTWNGTRFVSASSLTPGRGYWVFRE